MPIPKFVRPDLSSALIHLTGHRKGFSDCDALISILKEGKIRGTGNSGYVKGSETAACFSEMPLSSVKYLIEHTRCSAHPYGKFGIALSKVNAWSRGARPVIYLPDNESDWIPPEHRWRHVQLDFGLVDFSHEREWRSKGDFSLLNIGFYIIVPNKEQEAIISATMTEQAKNHTIGFLHLDYLNDFL